jgi:exopolysaccharide biosynthesis polyprenyl glycosylphosphotransferase
VDKELCYCGKEDNLNNDEIITIQNNSQNLYLIIKRIFDIIFSLLALMFLSPLLLVVAVWIKFDSPGPIIFKQKRVGKDGEEFVFYKFRSMREGAEDELEDLREHNEKGEVIFKIKEDPRITKIGKFIRRTSIDELPQLINVLKSDMSIVGPRPPLPGEVEKYNTYQKQRLAIKGGLTCYWQVSGRSRLSFEEWVDLDIKYIKDCSFFVDLKIIFRTFGAVLRGDGAA